MAAVIKATAHAQAQLKMQRLFIFSSCPALLRRMV
jgi:hypothetical protein